MHQISMPLCLRNWHALHVAQDWSMPAIQGHLSLARVRRSRAIGGLQVFGIQTMQRRGAHLLVHEPEVRLLCRVIPPLGLVDELALRIGPPFSAAYVS